MTILDKILVALKLKAPPTGGPEEPAPKDVQELIDRLPPAYHEFRKQEDPYKLATTLIFIVLTVIFGTAAWKAMQVPRAEMANLEDNVRKIDLEITVHLVPTSAQLIDRLAKIEEQTIQRLNEIDPPTTLNIRWNTRIHGIRSLDQLQGTKERSLDIHLALVDPADWTHFSANHAYMTCSQWTLIQVGDDLEKTGQRIGSLVWEVLIDMPHLEAIVKRDQREQMNAWQIAALPLSHQKRLVWDSAALSQNYIVQIIFLHQNAAADEELLQKAKKTQEYVVRFANAIKNVTSLTVSTQHLWDFGVMHYLEKDVQDRWVLSADAMQNVIKNVDMQLHSVPSSDPVYKLVVLETDSPAIVLDHTGEDSKGAAVAAWGSIVARNEKTDAHMLASLRVLLGIDAELDGGRARNPCPIAQWEITRMHLRAYVDNTLRARHAIRALHRIKDKIAEIVISKEVATKVNDALEMLKTVDDPHAPPLDNVAKARKLADSALADPSLLALLYFPQDQKFAVLIPIFAPLLAPIIGSIWRLFGYGWPWKAGILITASLYYYYWTELILPVVAGNFFLRAFTNLYYGRAV
ncbi:unnamed protein product, partial [Mesorhabditis spiculigera]